MKKVKYCQKSTITEAWVVIRGIPTKISENDPAIYLHSLQKNIPEIKKQPSVVFVQDRGDSTPPFWSNQFSWNKDKYLIRFGHQYLSLHFVKHAEDKYETYDKTLAPEIKKACSLWKETFSQETDNKRNLDRIGFGYINTFSFPKKEFDLTKHFKIQIGIATPEESFGLRGIQTAFNFIDAKRSINTKVDFNLEEDRNNSNQIKVVTRVFSEKLGLSNKSFFDVDDILETTKEIKEVAKQVFFEIAA